MSPDHAYRGAEILLDRADDWRDAAECRQHDPELWFPIGATGPAKTQTKEAQAICQQCDVRQQCLDFALSTPGISDGIYGGLTKNQRDKLRRRKT